MGMEDIMNGEWEIDGEASSMGVVYGLRVTGYADGWWLLKGFRTGWQRTEGSLEIVQPRGVVGAGWYRLVVDR